MKSLHVNTYFREPFTAGLDLYVRLDCDVGIHSLFGKAQLLAYMIDWVTSKSERYVPTGTIDKVQDKCSGCSTSVAQPFTLCGKMHVTVHNGQSNREGVTKLSDRLSSMTL